MGANGNLKNGWFIYGQPNLCITYRHSYVEVDVSMMVYQSGGYVADSCCIVRLSAILFAGLHLSK